MEYYVRQSLFQNCRRVEMAGAYLTITICGRPVASGDAICGRDVKTETLHHGIVTGSSSFWGK